MQLEERTHKLRQEIDELSKAKENFVQLSLFEEGFLREKETELNHLQAQIRALQSEVDREKETLIETANQIAYLKNDAAVKENLNYLTTIKKSVKAISKRKNAVELLDEINIEDCGKSRVYLGGLAQTLHERNLLALLQQMTQ